MASQEYVFINRELSWLEFNQRVLEQALDGGVPLLERLKFLAITASNLNEFFMVRVGGLQLLRQQNVRKKDPSGMTPVQQLEAISRRAHKMMQESYHCFMTDLEPAMMQEGIYRRTPENLTPTQSDFLRRYFEAEVFPVITPVTVEQISDFPLLKNLGVVLLVRFKPAAGSRKPRFAVIPVSSNMSRFISLPAESGYQFITIEDVIRHYAGQYFPDETIMECAALRITRNADMGVQEDLAADLLSAMESILDWRKVSGCVRMEIEAGSSVTLQNYVKRALKVDPLDIYEVDGPLALSDFMTMATMDGYDHLKFESWAPQPSADVDMRNAMFSEIAKKDLLLYHPYESFDPVVRMIKEAAEDPDVLAIKQILYRTSKSSPIVKALRQAALNGKTVTALIELKARFDEARNIDWARKLEQDGVQVIYGVRGFKTHAKICIVVRREAHGVVRYMHFGTGNYNESTARLYGDISYMTCNSDLGEDASTFFNAITGFSQPRTFQKLAAAPLTLRETVLEYIAIETERKRQGQKARIIAKMNSLVDPAIIETLYEASRAGVDIELNIRGICCLKPGIPGLSENIRVVSIIDRYLEHARIFYFYHGGTPQVFISSADWMPRNLDKRLELLVPVDDKRSRKKLVQYIEMHLNDTQQAWELLPDGSHQRVQPTGKKPAQASQEQLYKLACQKVKEGVRQRRTVFEPHRAPSAED